MGVIFRGVGEARASDSTISVAALTVARISLREGGDLLLARERVQILRGLDHSARWSGSEAGDARSWEHMLRTEQMLVERLRRHGGIVADAFSDSRAMLEASAAAAIACVVLSRAPEHLRFARPMDLAEIAARCAAQCLRLMADDDAAGRWARWLNQVRADTSARAPRQDEHNERVREVVRDTLSELGR